MSGLNGCSSSARRPSAWWLPRRARRATRVALLAALAFGAVASGCERDEHAEGHAPRAAPAAPTGRELAFKSDQEGLLLTWIAPDGEFHVARRVTEVPVEARAQVRAVLLDAPAGTADEVFVTNLAAPSPDGRYVARPMARKAWDALGAERRQARIEALRPPAPDAADPSAPVIIYGADWCKPCHLAEDYLRGRGVAVVKKDIEQSDVARDEMRKKLVAANMGGASIPVIDVGGTLLIGFSRGALDAALARRAAAAPRAAAPTAPPTAD